MMTKVGVEVYILAFPISALDADETNFTFRPLYPRRKQCYRLDPKAGLDAVRKHGPPSLMGTKPRLFRPCPVTIPSYGDPWDVRSHSIQEQNFVRF
jgi:hypothetical protein